MRVNRNDNKNKATYRNMFSYSLAHVRLYTIRIFQLKKGIPGIKSKEWIQGRGVMMTFLLG